MLRLSFWIGTFRVFTFRQGESVTHDPWTDSGTFILL